MYWILSFVYDDSRSVENASKSLILAKQVGDLKLENSALDAMGTGYYRMGKYDSSLQFMQQAYELNIRLHKEGNGWLLYNTIIPFKLGNIHMKLNNLILAESYYKISMQAAYHINVEASHSFAYTGLSRYFYEVHNVDSALYYANKLFHLSEKYKVYGWKAESSKILYEIYKEKSDYRASLKYLETYVAANDTINNIDKIQGIERLTFAENLRQNEIRIKQKQLEDERKANLQYFIIGIALVSLIIFYLLLSRSIIVRSGLIKFAGVVGLLLVFEFVNLLSHPFIGNLTDHSPLWMFLILVCIAALIVPAHHRIEKWVTHQLVEKNKRIRLAAGKKSYC